MKKILLHSQSLRNNSCFIEAGRDNCNIPLINLKKSLYNLGYELMTSDNIILNDDVKYIFFFDHSSLVRYRGLKGILKYFYDLIYKGYVFRNLYEDALKKGYEDKLILFLWEPKSIIPENWSKQTHSKFKTIFTWNNKYIDNKKFFKILMPQPEFELEIKKIDFNTKHFLLNISMNKYSNFEGELYSKRREIISFFEKNSYNDFQLYGFGWNKPVNLIQYLFPFLVKKYNSYQGTISSKHEIMLKFKFALCFENINTEYGWITEKIFDCFNSNCIPIYYGAPDIYHYIPKNCFIDMRDFKNYTELSNYLYSIDESVYEEYLSNIEIFLKSKDYKLFLSNNFINTITNVLKLNN